MSHLFKREYWISHTEYKKPIFFDTYALNQAARLKNPREALDL